MNDVQSTLMAHCGARKMAREELKDIPVPEGTKTHQPLAHTAVVEALEEALSYRHLMVVRDEYAVSADGMKMFGVMDLNSEFTEGRFSIGLRNSNDKSMRLALTAGYRVFVCDNMAFSGDFAPLSHKHTINFSLRDSISIAVDRIHRNFETLESQVRAMAKFGLSDNDAKLFIYRAFLDRALKGVPRNLMWDVHDHYFSPGYDEFKPRNVWSLSNAFTSAFKTLKPTKQFEVTARLGQFFTNEQAGRQRAIEVLPRRQLGQSAPQIPVERVESENDDFAYEYDDLSMQNIDRHAEATEPKEEVQDVSIKLVETVAA